MISERVTPLAGMLLNLFCSFDPAMRAAYSLCAGSFWLRYLVALGLVFPVRPFMGGGRLKAGSGMVGGVTVSMLKRMGVGGMQGWGGVLTALFFVVLFVNLGGLFP